jgi:tetratricopeptide (TPR) repeat protein
MQVISNIGVLFYSTEKFDDALAYFEQGRIYLNEISKVLESGRFQNEYFRFNLNTGAVYTKIKEYDKAELYFTKALQYLDEDDLRSYGTLLNNLSIIAREKGDIERAFDLNRQAIEVWQRANIMRGLAQSYNNLGNCYFYVNDFNNALENYKEALDISSQYGSESSVIIALEQMSMLYDTLGKYKLAFDTHVKFKNVSDSLLNLEKIHLVTQLELQEKFDRRMNESRLRQEQIKDEQRKREIIYTLVIVFIAMGLIIVVLLFYLQSSKSKRLRLEAEKSTLLNKSLELEKTKLEEDLEFKNKELATNVMYMIRKNELISRISEKLIKSKLVFKKENQVIIDEIIRDLKLTTDDDIWTEFEIRFQQVHNDFYDKLNERYPNLSANEKRLCAFLRLNMSTKEISAITHQSVNSLTVARSRLRKKLELDSDENLIFFLESL